MGRLRFVTHNEREDFVPHVIKWKLHGIVCFTLDCNVKLVLKKFFAAGKSRVHSRSICSVPGP